MKRPTIFTFYGYNIAKVRTSLNSLIYKRVIEPKANLSIEDLVSLVDEAEQTVVDELGKDDKRKASGLKGNIKKIDRMAKLDIAISQILYYTKDNERYNDLNEKIDGYYKTM